MMSSRSDRWPWVWFAIVVLLVIAVAGLSVGLAAASRSTGIANCINDTLGVRQQYTDMDHQNERRKILDQKAAEQDKARGLTELTVGKTRAAQLAGFNLYRRGVDEFEKSLADWLARDRLIAALRAKHPLGRC
jgi:hypothetical protein